MLTKEKKEKKNINQFTINNFIVPYKIGDTNRKNNKKKGLLENLVKIQFSNKKDKDLSLNMDRILYEK